MITSVFIIAISVILFVYWLRYSCLLLLRSAQERQALAVHTDERFDERFNVASVVERLKTEGDLDPLFGRDREDAGAGGMRVRPDFGSANPVRIGRGRRK